MGEAAPVPDCLTVEEAARVLRIGRTSAYALTRQWRETGGRAGIPNISFGTSLRVPTAALEQLLGRPITYVPAPAPREQGPRGAAIAGLRRHDGRPARPARLRSQRARGTSGTSASGQASLPLDPA